MKRFSLVLALLMVVAMFTACGGNTSSSSTANNSSKGSVSEGSTADTGDSVLKDGKMDELLMIFPGGNSAPASLGAVQDAINEKIKDKIDATVKIQILEWGVYADQTNLILSSGEKADILFSFSGTKIVAANGQVQSITDNLQQYAPETYELMEQYLEACRVNGELYGIPTFHEYARSVGLICRTDLLEATGISADSIKTWDDVENTLIKVREIEPNINLLVPGDIGGGMLPAVASVKFDELQSKTGVGVLMNGTDPADVVNLYATDEYREMAEMAFDWNKKGYFIADATTITDTRQELLAAGNTFGYIGTVHPGTRTQEIRNSGMDVTTIMIGNASCSTSNVNGAQFTIPSACTVPEKALALLNYLYTDEDVQNLIMYGIEGTDYEVKDEAKSIIGYPEGVDDKSVGWSNEPWLSGNASISHVWESDPETIWKDFIEYNDTADFSPVYGFSFNSDSVKTEISAISNVIDKYSAVIASGYSDVDEALEAFNAELESAGINKIIDEAKTQITAWLAE